MPYFDFKKEDGKPIAIIEGEDEEIIYLHDKIKQDCCRRCKMRGGCNNCNGGCCHDCNFDLYSENSDEEVPEDFRKVGKMARQGGYEEVTIKNDEEKIFPIPYKGKDQRDSVYVTAPSGAGKTTFAAKYIKYLMRINPKKEFFVFSSKERDKNLDYLNPKRIKIDDSFIEKPIETNELRDSIILFDDIDKISNKEQLKAVQGLRDKILEEGRDRKIDMVTTSHNPTNNKETKTQMLESRSIVLFPGCGDDYHVKTVLKNYYGLPMNRIEEILSKNTSRWIFCNKWAPKYIVTENSIFFP